MTYSPMANHRRLQGATSERGEVSIEVVAIAFTGLIGMVGYAVQARSAQKASQAQASLGRDHGRSVRYNRGTLLHPYTCKMSEHRQDRHSSTSSGHAAARHRFGQAVLLFPNVQKLKPVKNNFTVYFSDICR